MIKALLNGILKMLTFVINLFLLPINALFNTLFPDMSSAIGNFNTFVNTYVGGTFTYVFSILPPIFRSVLVIWFTFLISYYTIQFTYKTSVKLWTIIQKIKFW